MTDQVEELTPEYEFDVDSIAPSHIVEMYQEGNWVYALTDTGTRFRQHIPQGKRLNKKNGRFVFEAVEVA